MKRLLVPLLAALSFPTAVNANVDPKVAEMCMKAVDFQGCVNAMTGIDQSSIKKKELLEDTNLTNVKGVRNTIEKLIRKKK